MDTQTGTLQEIRINLIDFDVSNHREVNDDQALKDLAESIRADGLQNPVRVYRKENSERFVFGCGHRRIAAHKLLARAVIPALIMPPATEAQIRAAQAIENLHRQDLTPLEEAQACHALVQSLAQDAESPEEDVMEIAAAKIARTRSWVENRLALMRLSARVQELLRTNQIYLGHAQLIARLPDHDSQEEVAGMVQASEAYTGKKGDMDPPAAIHRCRELVNDRLRDLDRVPWKLDAVFADKPACSGCPHNSHNQPGLFDGDQPTKPKCLDASCFAEKTRFAGLAVVRASNTLAKMGKSTPTNANKAIAERDVAFLKTKPVEEAAKRKLTPKKATRAEKKGAKAAAIDLAQQKAFNTAECAWLKDRDRRISEELRKSAARIGYFYLLVMRQDWEEANSDWRPNKAALNKLQPYIAKLKNPNGAALVELAGTLKPSRHGQEHWPVSVYIDVNTELNDQVADAFCKVFDITLPSRPKLEDFKQSEHVPKTDKQTKPAVRSKKKRKKA